MKGKYIRNTCKSTIRNIIKSIKSSRPETNADSTKANMTNILLDNDESQKPKKKKKKKSIEANQTKTNICKHPTNQVP